MAGFQDWVGSLWKSIKRLFFGGKAYFVCPLCGSEEFYRLRCTTKGAHGAEYWTKQIQEEPYSNWRTYRDPEKKISAAVPNLVCFDPNETHIGVPSLAEYYRCSQCYSLLPDSFLRNEGGRSTRYAVLYLIGSSGVGKSTWYSQTLTQKGHIWAGQIPVHDFFPFMEPYTHDYLADSSRTVIDFLFGGFSVRPQQEDNKEIRCAIIDRMGEYLQTIPAQQQQKEVKWLKAFSSKRKLYVYLVIPYYCPHSVQPEDARPWIRNEGVFRHCFDFADRIRREMRDVKDVKAHFGLIWTRMDEHCPCLCRAGAGVGCGICSDVREVIAGMLQFSGVERETLLKGCSKEHTISRSAQQYSMEDILEKTKRLFQAWTKQHLVAGGDFAVWRPLEGLFKDEKMMVLPMARVIPVNRDSAGKLVLRDEQGVWYDVPLDIMWQSVWRR